MTPAPTARERLLMAGNQLGKTVAGGFEAAMHATGLYPAWWMGRRFERPTIAWVAGVTGESTRDNPQRILLGRPGQIGTGAIPKDAIVEVVPGARHRQAGRHGDRPSRQGRALAHRIQVLREGPGEMAGRDARLGLVRRGAAARHLYAKA